jgi:trigger factor
MEVKLNKVDDLNGVISLSIVESDYSEKVESTLKDYRKRANIPGFRPGKVPMGLIKKQAGTQVLVDEVNKLISSNLMNYITNEKLNILGEPMPDEEAMAAVNFENDKDFEFKFNVGFAPEFEIKLSKRNKVPYYTINVDDELVNKMIESFASQFGSLRNDFEVIEGDNEMIKADVAQLDENGEVLENGIQVENAMFSLMQIKNEETIELLKTLKKGDTTNLDIKKAVEHESDLSHLLSIAKEDVEALTPMFKFTVKEISKHVPSEINEDLFKKVFADDEIKTEEEFRAKVKEQQEEKLVKDQDYRFSIDAKDKILAKVEIPLPEAFLKTWLAQRNEKLTAEKLEEEWAEYAKTFKWQLFRNKFLADNEVKISEEDILNSAKEMTKAQFAYYGAGFNIPEADLEKYAKQLLENQEQANNIRERVYEEKVTEKLKEVVGLTEKEISMDDFNKLFEEDKK